jgi:membrane protein YdbS with pleckstrin-like domain
MSTALVLIIGGLATLKSISWGKKALSVGLGMVIYTEIVSPGYYAQQGQWLFVGMFAILLIGAVWSVMFIWREYRVTLRK